MVRKKEIKEIKDNVIELLTIDIGGRANSMHDNLIALIVKELYRQGYRKINYDHIKEIVPKEKAPLTIGGRRWDIVVQYGKDRYALIEVKTMKVVLTLEEEEIKEEDEYGNS